MKQILQPRFDDRYSVMPDMGVNEVETEAIMRFLLADTNKSFKDRLEEVLPISAYRNLVYALGGIMRSVVALFAVLGIDRSGLRRRRS